MKFYQNPLNKISSPVDSTKNILDLSLFCSIFGLLVIGLVMVSSASMEVSGNTYSTAFYILIKQIIFVFTGLFVMGGMLMVTVNTVKQYSWIFLVGGLGLLLIVLIVGREINGSIRWIPLGVFNFQASEAAKLMIIVYLAAYLVRRLDEVRTRWTGFLKPMAILAFSAVLLLMEPDFGSLVVLMIAAMGMIFLAGARLWHFIILIFLLISFIIALIIFEPYRMARLISYINPWENPFDSGYQLTQSLIAFGRGEWFGEGLGNSLQKLFYLPEAHTDFVYAVLAEEFGVVGSVFVLILFLFIAWRALQIGCKAEQKKLLFHSYVAYGIGLLFSSQAFINIGMNTGLLPTKGLALPMISYGGSNLLTNCLAFGLLLRIDYERRQYAIQKKKTAGCWS